MTNEKRFTFTSTEVLKDLTSKCEEVMKLDPTKDRSIPEVMLEVVGILINEIAILSFQVEKLSKRK